MLAYHVLQGKTQGYKNHPQLKRFNIESILHYIRLFVDYARDQRGYGSGFKMRTVPEEINHLNSEPIINVNIGQMHYEFFHLQAKLWKRNRRKYFNNCRSVEDSNLNYLRCFNPIANGNIEDWEHPIQRRRIIFPDDLNMEYYKCAK